MQNERKIKISVASTRFGTWAVQSCNLSELYTRLSAPARGTELREAYFALPKKKQDTLKDVGGFVGGELRNGLRQNGHVLGRDLITLDIDKVIAGGAGDIITRLSGLGCGYAVYSTRKHGPEAPRLRAIIPTDTTMTADEYEPTARRIAAYIDPTMQIFDRTTFEPARLMYWPSCCADSEYVYYYEDKPLANAAALLQQYTDWHDVTQWPRCPDENAILHAAAAKQENPTTKEGLIGAFCRVYDIPSAIENFLPGVYTPVSNTDNRMSYTAGSTTGGAVLYENGLFLFSHHATDPAGGRLVNAFDLVRLHLYGNQDDEVKAGTPVGRLPSYASMRALASADEAVYKQMNADNDEKIARDFGDVIAQKAISDTAASVAQPPAVQAPRAITFKVKLSETGKPTKTLDNAWALLETDPLLQGRIVLDIFAGRGIAQGPYPWNPEKERRLWNDNDDAGVQWYLERYHNYRSKQDVISALSLCGNNHSTDPVREYLDGLKWDGVPRLDTLFIDYLGAEDNIYTRAVTRKTFVAAVARTYIPGCKYDTMTVLAGTTGIGKSTLLRKMGKEWFSDSLQSFEGKDARELIQGVWIVEIGELGYMDKSETNTVKQFLSQQEDIYRAAYGRNTELHKRRCVFIGTTNEYEYLKDNTGNRRFWPIDVGENERTKSVFKDLDSNIDLLWAEAVCRYKLGEELYLPLDLEKLAVQEQEKHRQESSREGMILAYLDELVPQGFDEWEIEAQRAWRAGMGHVGSVPLVLRQRVCAAEIWVEVFHGDLKFMKQSDTREINYTLGKRKGWAKKTLRFKEFGQQRGYERVLQKPLQ